jgi:hypothetical protein
MPKKPIISASTLLVAYRYDLSNPNKVVIASAGDSIAMDLDSNQVVNPINQEYLYSICSPVIDTQAKIPTVFLLAFLFIHQNFYYVVMDYLLTMVIFMMLFSPLICQLYMNQTGSSTP